MSYLEMKMDSLYKNIDEFLADAQDWTDKTRAKVRNNLAEIINRVSI